mgnify:FL=1
MVLQDYKIDGDYIKVSKKELEQLRDHYMNVASRYATKDMHRWWYYMGKREICIDMLKMFEPLEG